MAKVSHIVLPVSDVPRSREWYVNKLGFTLERELEQAVGIKDQSGLTIFLLKATDPLAGTTASHQDAHGSRQETRPRGQAGRQAGQVQQHGNEEANREQTDLVRRRLVRTAAAQKQPAVRSVLSGR